MYPTESGARARAARAAAFETTPSRTTGAPQAAPIKIKPTMAACSSPPTAARTPRGSAGSSACLTMASRTTPSFSP